MRSRTLRTHGDKTEWVDLPILVPSEPGTRDGDFWEFEEELTAGVVKDSDRRWKLVSKPVRVIPFSDLPSRRTALPQGWRKHWDHFIALSHAVEGNQRDAQAFAERRVKAEHVDTLARNPRAWLAADCNKGISLIRFGLWTERKNGKLRPGLVCIFELSVPFALAAHNLASAKGMRVCQRERCGKLFQSTRPQQMFCSPRCRHADQQRRYRERHPSD